MATLELSCWQVPPPLLMHSDRFGDPLDPMISAHKALTSRSARESDTDHEDIARSELLGAIYFSRASGIHLPGSSNLKACCLTEAAKLNKLGTEFRSAGLLVLEMRSHCAKTARKDAATGRHAGLLAGQKRRQVGTVRVMPPPPALLCQLAGNRSFASNLTTPGWIAAN